MVRYGRYQRKLYATFAAIACIFVVLFTLFTGWMMVFSQRANYRALLQQTMAAKTSATELVTESIAKAMDDIATSPYAQQWAESTIGPQYYFSSSMLYQSLRRITANISNINYEIVITRPDPDSFMITSTGTLSKEEFFQTPLWNISQEQWNQLLQQAQSSQSKQAFLPVYQQQNLQYLYYMKQVDYPQGQPLLLLGAIPTNTLFGTNTNQDYSFFALHNSQLVAQNAADPKTQKELEAAAAWIDQQEATPMLETYQQYSHDGKEMFVLQAQHIPLKLVYIYPYLPLDKGVLLAIFLVLLLSAGGTLLVATVLSKKLYHPIGEIMSHVPINQNNGKPIDEFEVIEQNTATVSLLNEQLENAINEKDNLVALRYYRELLFTIPDWNCPLTAQQMAAPYCVALVEFIDEKDRFNEDDWYLQLQKNYLYVHVQGLSPQQNAYCISTNSTFCAVLLQTASHSQAKSIVQEFFSIPTITCRLRIALSDIQEYVMHIKDCYQQALQLMEYRHLLTNAPLITSDMVQDFCQSNYYYPMSTESRLILLMVSGNGEAISLFDSLVEQNTKERTLSPNSYRSLSFAFIGTLVRAFEELKTTPEELLGYTIDFSGLYADAANQKIFVSLRQMICAFVEAVEKRQQNSEDDLLQSMLDFIYANYSDDIMLNDIAQHCGVSASYCSTLFKRLSCDNFKTFLNRYRIEQACRFLQENPHRKISDLSQMVGFNSSSSFIRVFQRFMGTSPKAYAESLLHPSHKD